MPVDKLTIEQFAQKVKAKYPQYKDVNDSVLVEKMVAKYPEYKSQISYDTPKQQQTTSQSSFKSASDWLSIPQGYKPMVADNAVQVVDGHEEKVVKSKQRVSDHLNDIDGSIHDLIYNKKKDLQGRIVSEQLGLNPKEIGPLNPLAQQLESQLRQDVPVTPQEIEGFKNDMGGNQVMTRQALDQKAKKLAKTDPGAANNLKADIYRLDRQDNPEKESKVDENIEGIKNGEYDYDIVNGRLVKPEGFFASLVTGFKEKNKAFGDYDVYKTGDEKKIMDLINMRLKDDPDKAIPVPEEGWFSHPASEMARMIGGQPLKPLIGGGGAGLLLGPEAGAAAAAAISSPEMYKLSFGSLLPSNFGAIKKQNPNLSDSEILQKAIDLTNDQANTDAFVGAAMGGLAAKVGFAPTGLNKGLLQKSLGNALKQIGQGAVKKTIEGLGVGTVGAAGQYVKNIIAQKAGIPTDTGEGLAQQLWGGVGMTMAMTMIAKVPKLLNPKTYNQMLQSLRNVPTDQMIEHISELEKSGVITHEEGQATQKAIEEHKALDSSIKPDVPESDRIKVQELIKKRNELEASLETEDKAYHAETKEKIKSLNEQISNVSKGGERGELQGLIDQEHKAGNIDGFVTELLRDASENDLKKYFKEISEQAHDPNSSETTLATFGESIVNKAKEMFPKETPKESKVSVIMPGEISRPEVTTIAPKEPSSTNDILGEPVVTKIEGGDLYEFESPLGKVAGVQTSPDTFRIDGISAREVGKGDGSKMFESLIGYLKEKGIKTITTESAGEGAQKMHQKAVEKGLITEVSKDGRNATYTINEQTQIENAIPIRSAEEVPVGQTPGDSQPMGEGIPESGEAASAQEIGIPAEENTPTGQEGLGGGRDIGITHRQMDAVAEQLGLETYNKDTPESLALWDKEARERFSKDPDAVNKLIQKLRDGEGVDKVETRMMIMHIADLVAKYESSPTAEMLNQIKRTKDLFNISGREKAREFVARKGSVPVEEMLADYHQRDLEYNRAPLTEDQTAQSTKEYNEIKAVKDALDDRVAKLEADNARLKAEKAIEKIKKSEKKSGTRDFKAEREQILKDMKKKWDDSKGKMSATFIPYADRLVEIAPDVAKLIKVLVEEGVDNLPDLVKAAHEHLSHFVHGITEKDVHDLIAGEYNKPKQTRNQISEKIYDLRTEAKLINRLEALENGEEPKNEKARIKRSREVEELRQKIKEHDLTRLAARKARINNEISKLEEQFRNNDFVESKKEPLRLDKEAEELRDRLLELKENRQIRLLKLEYENRTAGQKLLDVGSKIMGTGRTLQSSFDVSYPFRQTIVGLSRQLLKIPFKKQDGKWLYTGFKSQKQLADQFGKMYRSFGSERVFRRVMADIKESPVFEKWQKVGLNIADPLSRLEIAKEEMYHKNYAEDIPGIKYAVKASHRSATVIANKMKWDIANQLAEGFERAGKTFENSPELYEATAKYVNQLVGRGYLGQKIEMASPVIGHLVYSLRLQASRLQFLTYLLNPKFYTKIPAEIRVEYLKDMARFIALGGTVLGLANAAGLGVGLDPRSSDFGSIISGDNRYDIWGGFKQYVILASRMLAGETLSPETGEVTKLEPGFGKRTHGDVVLRFLRTKASPIAGVATDVLTGKTFDKKDVTFTDFEKEGGLNLDNEVVRFVMPLVVKDISQAWKDGGVTNAMLTMLLATHGVGVQNFSDKENGGGEKSSTKSGLRKKSKHISHKRN